MTDEKKSKEDSKNKTNNEIEIENKDLLNVFFDNSGAQFESQFFLSRKRLLNAENGQNELSDLIKSKLKALDMMLLILTNNKNILKESDLSCCEVLNNLLSVSKKDKAHGEHIFSKIKTLMIYFIKNKISLKEKNSDENKILIKFLLTLYNIKFDNGYFKQTLELISIEKDLLEIFVQELFNKLFKGRNITIKIKEMKFIIKSILTNEKIIKNIKYFDIMEMLLNYAKEKNTGGCRTSFQLNQVMFLLQYMLEITNSNEIKKILPEKNEQKIRLLKIVEIFYNAINDMINKEDYEFDKAKISKKILEIKNDNIKRKKNFFGEMMSFLNKLKKNFGVFGDKEFNKKLEEINNLYKNIINTKYVIVINSNTNNNKKEEKNKEIKEETKEDKEKEKYEAKDENDDNIDNEENEENDINNDKNEIIEAEKEDVDEDEEIEDIQNEKKEIELEEEPKLKKPKKKENKIKKEKEKQKEKPKKEEEKIEITNKKTKRKESKNKNEFIRDNKNKKKKK